MKYHLYGNIIAAECNYSHAPKPPACPSCGGDLPHGADPDSDYCKGCKGCKDTADALDHCADKAAALARQLQAAARNAGYPDIKQRDIYLRIAHNCLAELIEMMPAHD